MIPVQQSILSAAERDDGHDEQGRPGDCLRACVASLLELPAGDVPHFAEEELWWQAMEAFIRRYSGRAVDFVQEAAFPALPATDDPDAWPRHVIACGPSPRGSWHHCVLVDATTGDLAHDPHPSGSGLGGAPTYLIVIAPREEATRG
jgi:hypothetical protein